MCKALFQGDEGYISSIKFTERNYCNVLYSNGEKSFVFASLLDNGPKDLEKAQHLIMSGLEQSVSLGSERQDLNKI